MKQLFVQYEGDLIVCLVWLIEINQKKKWKQLFVQYEGDPDHSDEDGRLGYLQVNQIYTIHNVLHITFSPVTL